MQIAFSQRLARRIIGSAVATHSGAIVLKGVIIAPESFSTSTNLLHRVQANQADAWRRLVDCYGPLVWHWCRQAELQAHDGADVFQQVFQSVFRRIGDFVRRPDHGSFRGWLLVVTQNQIRDHFRRMRGRANPTGGSDAHQRLLALADPDSNDSRTTSGVHPVSQLLHSTLERIRPEFEPRTWQAFWQTTVEGQPSGEVAEALGMTPGAVRKAKARILSRLRSELGDT
jgi:RNA polymerase sigma-70 factor (ECF subfamily)